MHKKSALSVCNNVRKLALAENLFTVVLIVAKGGEVIVMGITPALN